MRKQFISVLVMLMMVVTAPFTCADALAEASPAENKAIDLAGSTPYESASSLCWIGQELYMLGSHAVYRWTEGMDAPEVFCDLSGSAKYQFSEQAPEDAQEDAVWAKAISCLFADGDTLYGLHPYSGQVFEITREDMRPAAQLPQTLLKAGDADDFFFREIKSAACSNHRLFLLLGTDSYDEYDKTELFCYGLTDQSLKACSPTGAQSMAAGADGKLVLLVEENGEIALWSYDIASDAMDTPLAAFSPESLPSGLAWYGERNGIAYYSSNKVTLLDASGASQTKAYLPVSYADSATPAACSESGVYAYPYGRYVFLRDIHAEGEAKQTVLRLMGWMSPDLLVAFSIENPDIAVVSVEASLADTLKQAVLSANSEIDLFIASAPGDFATMKKKGFAAPLNSQSELTALARELYPTLQDVVFDGDTLLAYPIALQPHSWTVNETQWQALGLGDYPATYDELFQTIALWLDEYAEDAPEYTLSDIQQSTLDMLVSMIVREYLFQNETSGERLTFDTPAFRSLMTSVSQNAHLLSEENEQWGMPLLSSYYQGFGCSYNDDDLSRMLLPPTIDPTKEQALNASVELLFVNAASRQQEAAGRFVSFCARNLDMILQYMLYPQMNEPYQSPTFEYRLATLQEELASLQSRLDAAQEETAAAALREEISRTERTIASVTENRWLISEESISVYRSVAENIRVPSDSAYLAEGEAGGYHAIESVISQYCADGLDMNEIDAMIRALNQVAYMVYMEGK